VGPNGQPVQVGVFQVARELGHRGTLMLETCYGHIAANPDRLQSEVRYSKKEQTPGTAIRGVREVGFRGCFGTTDDTKPAVGSL